MGIQHDLIADFANYAKTQVEDHTEQLKQKYRSKDGSTESFRLKVFNDHLHTLKTQLHRKMSELTAVASVDSTIKRELEMKYDTCVNDFLKKDFNV